MDDIDKPVDLHGIATLLQVGKNTPNQWRQRTKDGTLQPPLPDPDFPELARPAWKTSTIIKWAQASDPPRWPPGMAARPHTRGRREQVNRITIEVVERDTELLERLKQSITSTNPSVPPALFSTKE